MWKHVPLALANVLYKFAYWMPKYFPKVLSPRCTIDHYIELELVSNPMAKVTYQLLGLELEELRK